MQYINNVIPFSACARRRVSFYEAILTGGWDMCGGNVGLGGLGAVGTGADAGTGGGIGAGAFVAGLEV